MIGQFLDTWELFAYSYLEGWLIGLVLAIVGVLVVARDQIFIGAAVSQASTVGIALALLVASLLPAHQHAASDVHSASWLHSDSFQVTMAALFSVGASLLTARGATASHRESHEAITGWVFLASASLGVLLVAHSPHGLEEIHRLHSSSIIGATRMDVWVFAGIAVASVTVVAATQRKLLLLIMDPAMAAASGMHVGRWEVFVAIWLGLAVGLAIRASGTLYTFAALVLPALVAKNVCREVWPMFFVAPAVALGTGLAGFVVANFYDFPPAQMTVALFALLLVCAWVVRRFVLRR